MPDFVAALEEAVKSSLCRMMDGLGDSLWTWGQGTGDGALSYLTNPASFIFRKFCNDEPPPAPAPPFEGGQCVCRLYNVTASGSDSTGGFSFTAQFWGPILDLSEGTNPSGTKLKITSYGTGVGACQQGPVANTWGDRILYPPISAQYSISTADGLPDECGSLPTEDAPLPPNWNIDNTDITYTNKDGLDLTIPLVFAWGYADLDFNANFRIPFTLRLGDSTNNNQSIFKGSLNVNTGDITYRPLTNYYGYPGPGSGPGDGNPDSNLPEYPSIDLPEQPPITPEEESGKESKLIAAIVTVVSLSSGSIGEIFQEGNPNIKIPNLGYINFFHRTGKISGAWSEDIPIKNTRQYVPVPFNGNVIDVRGTPRLGVTWVITPVFDTKQSDPQIPNESLVITGV